MPGPMQSRPASHLMEWCDHIDEIIEHFGAIPGADVPAIIDEAIDTLERRGAITAQDAATLRVVYSPAE